MAHRSPHRITSVSSPLARHRKPLRRSPTPRRKKPSSSYLLARPVLVPLHPNLRRLPSRLYLSQKDSEMVEIQNHRVGSKRKRVPSTNENAHAGGRPTGGSGTLKRQRIASGARMDYDSDDAESSYMDVDSQSRLSSASSSDTDDDDQSTDDFLINSAEPNQLQRLRKDELARLYTLAGLSDDTDALTKSEIIDAIVGARDDLASLPPSSPLGRGDGNSSEYSSDDGALAEPFRFGPTNGLRRRATTNDISKSKRPAKGRSFSMGQFLESTEKSTSKSTADSSGSSGPRRRTSSRSSPSTSANGMPLSPPAHHLRSRKVSQPTLLVAPHTPPPTMAHKSSKMKGKQVEFSTTVQIKLKTPSKRGQKVAGFGIGEESDLTELDESEVEASASQLSPRRLRSKDKAKAALEEERYLETRRITPMRKAKRQPNSQDDTDVEVDELDEDEVDEDEVEEEEVDELVSTISVTPPPVERTPVKRRLRPRPDTNENDGDDEDDDEDAEEVSDDETTIAVEPRKLRNGKILGEEDAEMDAEMDADSAAEEDEGDSNDDELVSMDDTEEETEETEETMDEVDLTVATAKTLIRLRRDDLVRLCEIHDLEPVGTKPQLAEALLEWRDRQTNDLSSPSSTGTIRPPSTVIKRRKGGRRLSQETPILERSNHFHLDEPLTPPVSQKKEGEPELELDLGTLGLEDREIPPEKLQKLEKIGSGGFKDVFVGKFRGRKIAISEFRGQLSAMDIKELKLLGGFDHPNIVRFLGVSIPENPRDTPVMIISELCANGDLFDYVRNVNAPPLHKVLSIMLDIARGLEYLHLRKPSVIHRDCKSSNILITSKGTAKIADFGLAKVKQSTRSMVRSLVGTVNWQAPELWHAHPKYNHKVDVFSCAMVYWEMLQWHMPNKKFPWEGMNEHAIYEIVGTKKQRPSISGLRKQWCPEIVDLMERMWAQEHQDRPTITEVVEALEEMLHHR